MMSSETVHLNITSQSYDSPPKNKNDGVPSKKPLVSTAPPSNGLQIEKPIPDAILRPPKSTLWNSILNPNVHATEYYNIVEDLAQAPCTMLTLEVLQTCPTQWMDLVIATGALDPENSNIISFKLDDFIMSQIFHWVTMA